MKNTFRTLITVLMIGLLSTQVFAGTGFEGTSGGGGGDPMANDFLDAGWAVKSLLESHAISRVNEDSTQFGVWLTRIQKSLDGTTPLLTFPEGRTVECFGETKIGCVDAAGKIKIARDTFQNFRLPEKYELVAQEIFKLMNVEDRYPKARRISDQVRIQTQTIEGHVKFMAAYQISTFGFRYPEKDGKLSLSVCTRIGAFIERIGILTELTQLVVMENKMDISVLNTARDLDDSARDLYPYCGINTYKKAGAKFEDAVARVDQAILRLQSLIGLPESKAAPIPPIRIQLKETAKPGLKVDQVFTLKSDLQLMSDGSGSNSWNYFTNGQRIDVATLLKREGQSFCAVNNTDGKMPEQLVRSGVREIPASASPFKLTEISTYVDTVFFEGNAPKAGAVGLVVYCAVIQNGNLSGAELTSMNAIKTHLRGILEPVQ